jgi:hypothetical protein
VPRLGQDETPEVRVVDDAPPIPRLVDLGMLRIPAPWSCSRSAADPEASASLCARSIGTA